MKITTDTNVLVRLFVRDNEAQTSAARRLLEAAEVIVIPTAAICEMVWVLRALYRQPRSVIINAIDQLTRADNVTFDSDAVEVGLAMLAAGGDFADGAIAAEGQGRGADVFTSFDREAVRRLVRQGISAKLVAIDPSDAG